MPQQHSCPSCFVNVGDNQPVCPNCGRTNPYYNPASSGTDESNIHHSAATAGKCEFCESVLYSDEKVCSHCGAPNPDFVVHGKSAERVAGGTRSHGTENASTGKCPYCGGTVRSNEKVCPTCGSVNPHYIEDTARVIRNPKTIEELQEYCAERDMPLLRMRFFIGENTQEPRAFGIYRDANGNTVVYKNKADRTRVVRYSGPDEARGVREIYQKLLEECRARGIDPDHSLRGGDAAADRTTASSADSKGPLHDAAAQGQKKSSQKALKALLICLVIVIALALTFPRQCTACLYTCASCVTTDGGYSSYDYDSGSGWFDWDSSDSGSDWGSSDWDSWDSGGSDWDSDW